MKQKLFLFFFVLFANYVFSQDIYELKFAKMKKLHLATVPFNNIEVIDTRYDTTTVYTNEDGRYPRVYCKFLPSTAIVFQRSLLDLIAPLNKTEGTLLINIKQFRIPNNQYIKRRGGRHKFYLHKIRNRLLLIADLYRKTGYNKYRKIASLEKEEIMLGIDFKNSTTLNDLIKAAAVQQDRSKDSDTSEISLEQVAASTAKEWSSYPVMHKTSYQTGIYITFDDFKNDISTSIPFNLTSRNDSIYTFNFSDSIKTSMRLLPYVVSDRGYLFIQLSRDKYLKLEKKEQTFYFIIPGSLSNMYDLLSIESINSVHSGYSGSSGNLFLDLLAITVAGVTDEISKSARVKKIKQHQESEKYRQVAIDMYSGDFIF